MVVVFDINRRFRLNNQYLVIKIDLLIDKILKKIVFNWKRLILIDNLSKIDWFYIKIAIVDSNLSLESKSDHNRRSNSDRHFDSTMTLRFSTSNRISLILCIWLAFCFWVRFGTRLSIWWQICAIYWYLVIGEITNIIDSTLSPLHNSKYKVSWS